MSLQRLRAWAMALKREVVALWFTCRDARTPWLVKVLAMVIVAYALSPIDLIPDFIPVLGYLDELILLPGAIYLTLRLIPPDVLEAARARAAQSPGGGRATPGRWLVAGAVVAIWLALTWLAWRALAPLFVR